MKYTPSPLHCPQRPARGFTLIELMIALAIVALLAAVAFPSFQGSVRKGRRAEALTALSALQQAQERWRGNNSSYTTTLANSAGSGAAPNGLGIAGTTPTGYYTIAVTDTSATEYVATATAVSGTSQAQDGDCQVMGVKLSGGTIKYGSGSTSITWSAANPDTGKCWAR